MGDYEDVAAAVDREAMAEAAHDKLEAAHAAQARLQQLSSATQHVLNPF